MIPFDIVNEVSLRYQEIEVLTPKNPVKPELCLE